MKRFLFAACLSLSACVGSDFDEVFITDAQLTVDMKTVMVVVGGSGGSGVLTFTQAGGVTGSCSVQVLGPMLGVMFSISAGTADFNLGLPEATVPLSDVFGAYNGTGAGASLIIGGETHEVKNRKGVSMEDSFRVGGGGMFAAIERLRIVEPNLEDCVF